MILLLACRVATVTPAPPDATPQPPYQRAAGATYVGVATCGACHRHDSAAWALTGHAHAMEALVDRKSVV